LTTEKNENSNDERPLAAAKGNAPVPVGRESLSYVNRDQQQVTIPVANIASVDEIVPSGTWDCEQRDKDDLIDKPIIILDAINMTGQQNPFVVTLCVDADTSGKPVANAEMFSMATSGVPYNKVRRAMGFDEDGRMVGNNRLPMSGKLVKVTPTSGGNWYWDFKSVGWTPTAVS
jgi:hypothetical protein